MNPTLSRREFLGTVSALPLVGSRALAAASARPRVGCQANGFPIKPGDFPALLGALRKMKELGYTGFECNVRFVEPVFDRVSEARKQIEDTGVEFIGAHMSMQSLKPELFPSWVGKLRALGGSSVVMSGPGLAQDGVFPAEALARKASSLNQLGETCRAGGLRLAYHNHNPEFAGRNAEMDGLAASTDRERVSFLMDAGHAKLGGGDPAAFMTRYADRIFGCHIKTFKALVQVPLGEGDWDFVDLAAAVKATQWSGWLIVEEGGGPKPGNTAALAPDRAYIRKVFGV